MKRIFIGILFFCLVVANAQVSLVKGPYLQIGTPGTMIVKWQTNIATNTKINYGQISGSLNLSYSNSALDTVHEAYLTGLNPYTKYYYAIGSSTMIIQGDTNNYFVTSPIQGTSGKFRFWITGDCGNGSANQLNVKNKYLQYNGNRLTNGWLLLGDNAYNSGLDSEFNYNFFNVYKNDIMKKAVLWPTPGNHDYGNNSSNQNTHAVSYYTIFNVPTAAQAGGVASGTEAFYSYNYGNIHFVSLDSYGRESNQFRIYDTLGPQTIWLKQDLAANTLPWTVVYFHHPPYTMASHNSDTEAELDSIRKNLVRILERYGVDFVLCGHSHGYERSKLMNGHYGYETTFNSSQHQLSTSSALYDNSVNSCPYSKTNSNKGTVYIVSGSAGSLGGQQASFPHDAMYYSNTTDGGSLILDVDANRADLKFLCADGIIRDNFTVFKNVNTVNTLSLSAGQSATLVASWPGNYNWSGSTDTLRQHIIHPLSDTTYWVNDKFNCVADTFHVKIYTGILEKENETIPFTIYPNPAADNFTLVLYSSTESVLNISVDDLQGRNIFHINKMVHPGSNKIELMGSTETLTPGIYQVAVALKDKRNIKKLVMLK